MTALAPVLSEEVAAALRDGGPVVALETTLVSHGFPGRQGMDVALASEARVRAAGAIPATVGVVDGAVRAGLTEAELERFAAAGESARKAGARDLAACVVQGALGATTVGGTRSEEETSTCGYGPRCDDVHVGDRERRRPVGPHTPSQIVIGDPRYSGEAPAGVGQSQVVAPGAFGAPPDDLRVEGRGGARVGRP